MSSPVTQSDLARAAGVSQNTVSLALRGDPRISEKTREHVRKIAEKKGYQPNAMVAALMSAVRRRRPATGAGLALVLAGPSRRRAERHPSLCRAIAGMHEHGQRRGFRLNEFWLRDEQLSPERLQAVLLARGIRGVVFHPDEENPEPTPLRWDHYAAAVLSFLNPKLSQFHCASGQVFRNIELVIAELEGRGYKRIGLAIPRRYDAMVDRLYSGAFLSLPEPMKDGERIPPMAGECWGRGAFLKWFHQFHPDVVLTRTREPWTWLKQEGYTIPDHVGLAHLGWHPELVDWAGIDSRPEAIGAAAVDLVIEQLQANELDLPAIPKMVLIAGKWKEGPSVKAANPG